jgi:predicted PilT family ATPase
MVGSLTDLRQANNSDLRPLHDLAAAGMMQSRIQIQKKGVRKMKLKLFVLAALVAAIMVGGFHQGALAKGTKTRIALTASADYPAAKGKATYKVDGSEREFQVEVENIKKLAGKAVNVFVNGVKVGSATVNSLGAARLNLNTNLGNAVPSIKTGDQVQVKTGAGKVIVAGSF